MRAKCGLLWGWVGVPGRHWTRIRREKLPPLPLDRRTLGPTETPLGDRMISPNPRPQPPGVHEAGQLHDQLERTVEDLLQIVRTPTGSWRTTDSISVCGTGRGRSPVARTPRRARPTAGSQRGPRHRYRHGSRTCGAPNPRHPHRQRLPSRCRPGHDPLPGGSGTPRSSRWPTKASSTSTPEPS